VVEGLKYFGDASASAFDARSAFTAVGVLGRSTDEGVERLDALALPPPRDESRSEVVG
jgi:hypothetical protein